MGISASYEDKASQLCVNQGTGAICTTGTFYVEYNLAYGSLVKLGGSYSFGGRIGDFRIHNNDYLSISDWNSQYAARNSCPSGCALTAICFSQFNQWCGRFLPLVQPSLWSSPFLTITTSNKIITGSNEIYYGKSSPLSANTDITVTGWIKASVICGSGTMFLKIMKNVGFTYAAQNTILGISMTTGCTTLSAKVFDTTASNDPSLTLAGFTFAGTWAFFAVTSSATTLTLYGATGASLTSNSASSGPTMTIIPADVSIYVGGGDTNAFQGDYADIRLYPGLVLTSAELSSDLLAHRASYKDSICTAFSDPYTCTTCPTGWYIVNGMCQRCHPSCLSCTSGNTELSCVSCNIGYYAQPGHANLCLKYCPLGYNSDDTTHSCTGSAGIALNINFENNLSGDITQNNVLLQFGISSGTYFPNYDFQDPQPANKRGIYLDKGGIKLIPLGTDQIIGVDYTLEFWAYPRSYGTFFSAYKGYSYRVYSNYVEDHV